MLSQAPSQVDDKEQKTDLISPTSGDCLIVFVYPGQGAFDVGHISILDSYSDGATYYSYGSTVTFDPSSPTDYSCFIQCKDKEEALYTVNAETQAYDKYIPIILPKNGYLLDEKKASELHNMFEKDWRSNHFNIINKNCVCMVATFLENAQYLSAQSQLLTTPSDLAEAVRNAGRQMVDNIITFAENQSTENSDLIQMEHCLDELFDKGIKDLEASRKRIQDDRKSDQDSDEILVKLKQLKDNKEDINKKYIGVLKLFSDYGYRSKMSESLKIFVIDWMPKVLKHSPIQVNMAPKPPAAWVKVAYYANRILKYGSVGAAAGFGIGVLTLGFGIIPCVIVGALIGAIGGAISAYRNPPQTEIILTAKLISKDKEEKENPQPVTKKQFTTTKLIQHFPTNKEIVENTPSASQEAGTQSSVIIESNKTIETTLKVTSPGR